MELGGMEGSQIYFTSQKSCPATLREKKSTIEKAVLLLL
jgi:hypothetical protein